MADHASTQGPDGGFHRSVFRLDLGAPRGGGAGTLFQGMIVFLGGEDDNRTYDENEGFDLKSNRWVKLAPLPSPRHGIAAATVGTFAYFAGGAQGVGGNGTSDQVFAFSMP